MASQESSSASAFTRRPYTGSCHCGTIKYVVYLSLPPSSSQPDGATFRQNSGLSLYKCNCTTCHKMGIFHLRLASAPDDFLLLSPPDPAAEGNGVTAYKCNAMKSTWYFCATCGVRCFTVKGEVETGVEIEVPVKALQELGLAEEGDAAEMKKVPVWKAKKEGWKEGRGASSYFSLNATSLNPGQEGLDLREWHEKGWIAYGDALDRMADDNAGKPHRGGMY